MCHHACYIPSAEHTWRGVRTTHSVMNPLTTQLGSLCNFHFHIHVTKEISHSLVTQAESFFCNTNSQSSSQSHVTLFTSLTQFHFYMHQTHRNQCFRAPFFVQHFHLEIGNAIAPVIHVLVDTTRAATVAINDAIVCFTHTDS